MDANAKIKATIRQAIAEKGLTQKELAARLGIKQPSLAERLSEDRAKIPQSLIDLLDALNLELTVKPKGKEPEPMDAETKAWLEADLAPPLEPYDWGDEDPETLGEPLRYEVGRGWVSD